MGPSPGEGAGPRRRADFGACFFLSYARTPRLFDEGPDPNYWVKQFYRDLCLELVSRDPRWHREGRPGFIDDSVPGGALWAHRLADQLASCRVFMPLYSRAYFNSTYCGREWAIFRERQIAHVAQTGAPNEAVIPVLWQPVRLSELPSAATAVQIEQISASGRYLERGLFELIRLDRDNEYLSVIIRLAELLDDVARAGAPPPGPLVGLDDVQPLFPGEQPDDTVARRLHIGVAAHHIRSVPAHRDHVYYGEQPEDWNPYHPESTVPLANRAEVVAHSLGYVPVLDVPPGAAGDPAESDPDGPELVLLDPWMVDDPDSAGRIAALDRNLDPWRKVLVPWSTTDPQTVAHAQVLRAKLQLTMPRSMASWRRFARAATRDLSSLADFGHALPAVIEQLWSSYIKAVRLKTPHGEHAGRPRLDPGALPPLAEPGTAREPTGADDVEGEPS